MISNQGSDDYHSRLRRAMDVFEKQFDRAAMRLKELQEDTLLQKPSKGFKLSIDTTAYLIIKKKPTTIVGLVELTPSSEN